MTMRDDADAPAAATESSGPVITGHHEGLEMSDIDPAPWREEFARTGRVQIPGFLTDEAARRAHEAAKTTPWRLVFHDGRSPQEHIASDFLAQPPAKRADLERQLFAMARDNFAFYYFNYAVGHPEMRATYPDAFMNRFFDFLNSKRVLDFARAVTGFDNIAGANAQATCYGPGHFLTIHDDRNEIQGKLAAFVVSLSPEWKTDWGGLTLFYDDWDGPPTCGLIPRFGAITMFRVPQIHSVSMVTPIARAARFSVTGWFLHA